jgi:hypothetical protein
MDPFEALSAAAGGARAPHAPPPPPPPDGVDPLAALTAALHVDGGNGSAGAPPLPPPPPPPPPQAPPPPVHWADFPVPPPVAALFAEADADGDGQVGRADAKAFFLRTGVPGPILAKARPAAKCALRACVCARGASGASPRTRATCRCVCVAQAAPRHAGARAQQHTSVAFL